MSHFLGRSTQAYPDDDRYLVINEIKDKIRNLYKDNKNGIPTSVEFYTRDIMPEDAPREYFNIPDEPVFTFYANKDNIILKDNNNLY